MSFGAGTGPVPKSLITCEGRDWLVVYCHIPRATVGIVSLLYLWFVSTYHRPLGFWIIDPLVQDVICLFIVLALAP